jgi:hypothetical protein
VNYTAGIFQHLDNAKRLQAALDQQGIASRIETFFRGYPHCLRRAQARQACAVVINKAAASAYQPRFYSIGPRLINPCVRGACCRRQTYNLPRQIGGAH